MRFRGGRSAQRRRHRAVEGHRYRQQGRAPVAEERRSPVWHGGKHHRSQPRPALCNQAAPGQDVSSSLLLERNHWASRPAHRVEIERQGAKLAAYVERPTRMGRHPVVVLVQGPGSSKRSHLNLVTACCLSGLGIATILFDFSRRRGQAMRRPDLDAYLDDLAAVVAWAQEQDEFDPSRVGVAGSSLGSVVAARAQAEGRVHPAAMLLYAPALTPDELRAITAPVLVLIGSRDRRLASVQAVVAGNPSVSLSVVEGAGRSLAEPGAADEAARRSARWFRAMLLGRPEERTP